MFWHISRGSGTRGGLGMLSGTQDGSYIQSLPHLLITIWTSGRKKQVLRSFVCLLVGLCVGKRVGSMCVVLCEMAGWVLGRGWGGREAREA